MPIFASKKDLKDRLGIGPCLEVVVDDLWTVTGPDPLAPPSTDSMLCHLVVNVKPMKARLTDDKNTGFLTVIAVSLPAYQGNMPHR